MKKIALYAGSFDPITNGHMDVIESALNIADEVVVAIGVHPGKVPIFSFEERSDLILKASKDQFKIAAKRISVISFDNLLVKTAKKAKATMLVRGLRDSTDFDYEMQMAGMNDALAPKLQTVFFPAHTHNRHITSTLVRQIGKMKGDVSSFVPPMVAKAIAEKF
ncbi:MAG: pantetheine-phosphate adenylyltransferase [Nitratireductor sp.]